MTSDTKVGSHTRNGKPVRSYTRLTPEQQAQKKRHQFERRVLGERQRSEADYPVSPRTPGQKQRRKKTHGQRAQHHLRRAIKTSRRHKGRIARHLALAGFFMALAAGKHIGRGARGAYRGGMRLLAGRWS